MIPSENTSAWNTPLPREPDSCRRKNETVIGIIGNTHGVKIEARPNPNAITRNAPNPCTSPAVAGAAGAAAAAGAGRPGSNSL